MATKVNSRAIVVNMRHQFHLATANIDSLARRHMDSVDTSFYFYNQL